MKKNRIILLLFGVLIIISISVYIVTHLKVTCESYDYKNCPAECELCGESVVSSYAKCHTVEFCKQIHDSICSDFSVDKCPQHCVVCPPCNVCSSISCQSEGFCKGIGFNKTWYSDVLKKINGSTQ